MRFVWSTAVGTLGDPAHEDSKSAVTWRAPTNPAGACDAEITVEILDQEGLKTRHAFAVGCAHLVLPTASSRGSYTIHTKADSAGNIYVSGVFYGTLTLGEKTLTLRGGRDAFLARFDANGRLLWIKQFGDRGQLAARGLVLDGDAAVYAGYYFQGESVEVEGRVIQNTSRDTNALGDSFIVKYSSDGALLWVRELIGGETVLSNSLVLDRDKELYAIGHFSSGGSPVYKGKDGVLQRLTPPPSGSIPRDSFVGSRWPGGLRKMPAESAICCAALPCLASGCL